MEVPNRDKDSSMSTVVGQCSEHTLQFGPGFLPGLGCRRGPPEAASVCSVLRDRVWKMHDIPHLGRRMSPWKAQFRGHRGKFPCLAD